jgi:molybdate transport system substrate-binding protein
VSRRPAALLTAFALLSFGFSGCGGDSDRSSASSAPGGQASAPGGQASESLGSITVLAAASLTEAFTTLGDKLEKDHPGTTVRFSFAASSELATQITSGAPADVFASASRSTMDQVVDAGGADGDPVVFVRNRLQIAVPAGNPADVTGLADFAKEDLKIALCAPDVPCGDAADRAFEAAGVTAAPDTLEPDVKAVLSKVSLGEVDAALVYRTDVISADQKVEGIDFAEATDVINDYPIVVLADAPNSEGAEAFVGLVESPQGAAVLEKAGFEQP